MTRIAPMDHATVTGETAAHLVTVRKMLGGTPKMVMTAAHNACGYCLSAHTAIGMRYGLDASTLGAARRAQSSDPRTAALLTLAVATNQSRGPASRRLVRESR